MAVKFVLTEIEQVVSDVSDFAGRNRDYLQTGYPIVKMILVAPGARGTARIEVTMNHDESAELQRLVDGVGRRYVESLTEER